MSNWDIEFNQTKQEWANCKRLPKYHLMTVEIYKYLTKEALVPNYYYVRFKLAICLFCVTDVYINELLNIQVFQLKTLTKES